MRAPNKSGLDKVVRRIVKELGSDPDGRDTSEAYVRTTIRLSPHATAGNCLPLWFERTDANPRIKRQNDDDFDALLKSIVDLQKALKKTSGPALFLLFSGEDDVHSNAIPLTEKQQKFERRTRAFVSMLRYLRARCNYLLAAGPQASTAAPISGNAAWHVEDFGGCCECHGKETCQAVQWTAYMV